MTTQELKHLADLREEHRLRKFISEIFYDFCKYYKENGFELTCLENSAKAVYRDFVVKLSKQEPDTPYAYMTALYILDLEASRTYKSLSKIFVLAKFSNYIFAKKWNEKAVYA